SEHVTEVFTAFGRTGASAEKVAEEAIEQARDYLSADVPVGPYLADQILLPLAISAWQAARGQGGDQASSQSGGTFRTPPLTRHPPLDNAHRDSASVSRYRHPRRTLGREQDLHRLD